MTDAERVERTKALLARPDFIAPRPVWTGCNGFLRIGHGGDLVTMLDDLKIPRQA